MKTNWNSRLGRLMDEAREFCEMHPGSQKALAECLRVHAVSVCRWLNKQVPPGGAVTLEIQAWLWREKGKQRRRLSQQSRRTHQRKRQRKSLDTKNGFAAES